AYAPLIVTEFQPNPIGSDDPNNPFPTNPSTDTEWIEIYNPNAFDIPLSDYKVSNTPNRGSSQGAYKFKSNLGARSTITAGAVIVVAREKVRFVAGNPNVPAASVYDLKSDLTQYTAWASGDLQLDNSPGTSGLFEEQVVLLDAKDGVVDMATYGNTTTPYPGHTPIATSAVPEGASYERCPAARDTNNSNVDFTFHASLGEQTPGQACLGVPGLDLTIAKDSPANALKDENSTARYVPYTITYENVGTAPENAPVTVVDTLPTGLSFTNPSVNASPQPTSVSADGKVLTWTFPTGLLAGARGTIVLTATVDDSVGQNVPLINNVSISGPSELTTTPGQRPNTAQSTTTTLGPADTSVNSNLSGAVPPGAQFAFTITYRNTGQDDATDVKITDVLPPGVTILSEVSDGATWDGATTGTVVWDVGALPANGSGTIVVIARLDSAAVIGSPLPNSLSITVPVGDPTPSDNTEAKTLTVGLRKLYVPLQRR
ncbi:MAG TPA: lamin tail domain-containing protein, partial [Roseiflexaceae bacterium]|nr:lamin tail domain-containing protein [Roseiflexaceae bacterium]